jgi:gamma-glutamyltranspeptidase / glutathione hydrolase
VSLIQSNAAGFGSLLVEPSTGVFLHNRGIGFSLTPGHPAELGPGRRPPHTLSPALVTSADGSTLRMVVGTEGGDTQPQVLLQLLARTLLHGQSAGDAMAAPRFVLGPAEGSTGFDVWRARGRVRVEVEHTAPSSWPEGLAARGHVVEPTSRVGLAHLIEVGADRMLAGASEPRVLTGSASGY